MEQGYFGVSQDHPDYQTKVSVGYDRHNNYYALAQIKSGATYKEFPDSWKWSL